jgi:Trypsin
VVEEGLASQNVDYILLQVNHIEMHPQYNQTDKLYDVALLFVAQDFTTNKYVKPICLWNGRFHFDDIVNTNGTVRIHHVLIHCNPKLGY